MNVSRNRPSSLSAAARAKRSLRLTRSILLIARTAPRLPSFSPLMIRAVSAPGPDLIDTSASTSTTTASASETPCHARATIARSSRRLGAKMPGVSTKMSCVASSMTTPRTTVRVVCTFGETIAIFAPMIRLSRVDLPALGAPIKATNPHRVTPAGEPGSGIGVGRHDRQEAERRRFLGCTFGLAIAALGGPAVDRHLYMELRLMIGALGLNDPVIGKRQAARLRPLLECGLGILRRASAPAICGAQRVSMNLVAGVRPPST